MIAEGLLDSLLLVEALMHIEREFGIQLSLAELDLDTFRSVRTISVYIQSQLGGDDARAVGED